MSDRTFVGREDELRRLNAYLDAALAGQGQVCFVSGEPGSGKTALAREFGEVAQGRQSDLLVAAGDCNSQTGSGEAFLPFREVLAQLTGNLDVSLGRGALNQEGASRLKKLAAVSGTLLIDIAPDLVSAVIPGGGIVLTLGGKIGQAAARHAGIDTKLLAIVKRQPAQSPIAKPTIERENIFEQYSRFLLQLAERQPLVLVLDDLQWIDPSSADLLFHLTRRIEKSRILIVGTYRPAEIAAGRMIGAVREPHPLERVLAEIKRYYGDVVLSLDAVDPPAARRFVHALVDVEPNHLLSDFREALYERTDGNPLFVVELLRDLRERGDLRKDEHGDWVVDASLDWTELPARVEGIIEGRIGRLDEDLRETLTVASAQGDEFAAEVVAQVLSLPEREAVRRCSEELARHHRLIDAAGVLRLPAARISLYRFQHRLLRLYLYDGLDEARRSYLHEDVAKALEALYQGQTDDVALELAWHYAEAGLDSKAAAWYRRAGELAAARYANDEAVGHLTRSLSLTPELDARARYELLLARERVYEKQGRRPEQAQDLAALAGLAAALQDEGAKAAVSLRQANLARVTGKYADAWTHAQAAVEQAGKAGDKLTETESYALLGLILRHQGSFGDAAEWLELALDQAKTLGEEALAAQITYWVGLNRYSADQLAPARECVMAARAAFAQLSDRMGQVNCTLLLGAISVREGDNGAAIGDLEQALAEARQVGWRSREAFVLGDLANVQLESGNDELARQYQLQALEIARDVGDREGEAVYLDSLGLVEHQLGRYREAAAFFEQALAIAREIGYRRGEGYCLTHLGYAHLELGEVDVARQHLQAAMALRFSLAEGLPTVVDNLAGLARVELAAGHPARAASYADDALGRLRQLNAEGVEYPVRAYFDCYRVLHELGGHDADAHAAEALNAGYELLQKRAGCVQDAQLRHSLLTRVPFNRELAQAYESMGPPRV